MSGQLVLVIEAQQTAVQPVAVWETLPPELQVAVTLCLGRLLAAMVQAARDE